MAGKGRVALNDGSWLAYTNSDTPQGTIVRIIAIKGIELVVEPKY